MPIFSKIILQSRKRMNIFYFLNKATITYGKTTQRPIKGGVWGGYRTWIQTF